MRVQKADMVSFCRKPNQAEMKVYTQSVNQGLNLLGKQMDIIIHNASAPAVRNENTGIGSLFSKTVQTKLIPFLRAHGFSGIQQEPNSMRKVLDNSPYAPESNAKNVFMIPLEKLASDEYGNILSKKTFNDIVKNNPNSDEVDYRYVREKYDIALKEAYNNSKNSPEFIKYLNEKEPELEKAAIFHILDKKYQEQPWNELDNNLYNTADKEGAQARIKELKEKYRDDYNLFIFNQMILDKETKAANLLNKKHGIKVIGDSPVAQSAVDEWVNKDLFLEGKAIGCPPDSFSSDGQRWGFKYYKPEELFNKDGSLGKAGEILKKKYEDYFANFPGGIRIDHIIGLIDPFIYTVESKKMTPENSGRIFSVPGEYQKHSLDEYAEILTKIVLPAAEKHGLDKSSIICEDLGDLTDPVREIMKKYELPGIAVTQYDYRGKDVPEKNIIMIGSHDNQSFSEYVDNLFANRYNNDENKFKFERKIGWLAEDTACRHHNHEQRHRYFEGIKNDKSKFMAASFAELFTSPAKRIQIFFTDLFGIAKTYNRPGTVNGNWSLRLGENFEDDYYKAASENKAPNFPQAIATALRHRGLDKGNEELMNNLDNSAKIIQEK